jgi:hypothetical protein
LFVLLALNDDDEATKMEIIERNYFPSFSCHQVIRCDQTSSQQLCNGLGIIAAISSSDRLLEPLFSVLIRSRLFEAMMLQHAG